MELNKIQREKIREYVKEQLALMPKFDYSDEYQRISLDKDLLQQIIFEEGTKFEYVHSVVDDAHFIEVLVRVIKFNIDELRKLDLTGIDFENVLLVSKDLSYTNADINPQTVYNKSLKDANLECVDLRGKDFSGVCIENANLISTGAFIDKATVEGFDSAKLTGCDWTDSFETCLDELKGTFNRYFGLEVKSRQKVRKA